MRSATRAAAVLGIGKHDVAIPVGQFKEDKGKIVLGGATKEALKAMPSSSTQSNGQAMPALPLWGAFHYRPIALTRGTARIDIE